MKKTIGILAHVDAGKTTLAEQLLYHTKSIGQRGRVDHKDTFLDNHDIEKERGITVFSEQGIMSYNSSTYYLIDTPGHVDFSPEMERAIQVMDYAVIIISAVEGVEGHTETVWQLLRKYNVPTFFFINKIDRVGADVEKVLEEINTNLSADVCYIWSSFQRDQMEEELIEFIAERSEHLFEYYMDKGYDESLWLDSFVDLIKKSHIYPCFSGSALKDSGVESFMKNLDILTKTDYLNGDVFAGRVYKIRHDEKGTRITFIKAMHGSLKVRDKVRYGDDEGISEKITQIRVYNGSKYKTVDEVHAGEIFAVTGLSQAADGDGVGSLREKAEYDLVPTLKSKVIFQQSVNAKEALKSFYLLDAEDSSLRVTWQEKLQEIHIHVMGVIQLEVLVQIIKDRFQLDVLFGDPEILYKETLESEVIGYGHFEPLGHYAEVHLKIEPAIRNAGITFVNRCHANDLSIGHQNVIRQHLFERNHNGILTGAPVTDLKVSLLTGKAHNKHTSGGDFREATYRALRQGLEKAQILLLEPFYKFKIKVELDHMGRVLSDIQNAHGTFDPPENIGDKVVLTGKVPVATFMHYYMEFAAITQGKGAMSLIFAGYYPCHNPEEVIERISYNKKADPEYSSSSIFCAKGQGYTVPWDEAESKMHC